MEKGRLDYLDMSKGIGIILVVLGHIVYTNQYVMVWISSFHMALFFIVSGVLLAIKDEKDDLGASVKKRVRGIVIPYLWFSLIDFILDIGNVLLGKIDKASFNRNLVSSLTFYGKSVLWFLTALFLTQVYFLLIRHFFKEYMQIILIAVVTVVCLVCKYGLDNIYVNHADSFAIVSLINFARTFVRAGVVLPFFGYGFFIWKFINKKIDGFSYKCGKNAGKIELLIGLVLLAAGLLVSRVNGSVDTNNMILNNVFLYYLGGFFGGFGIILTFKPLVSIKPLIYLGKNSLIIMATHLDCYILWAGLKVGLILFGIIPNATLLVVVALVLTLLVNSVLVEIINRFFPFITGKKKPAMR